MVKAEIKEDYWLTNILNLQSFHLTPNFTNIEHNEFENLNHCFIDTKVEVQDSHRIFLLEKAGFHLVDTSIQLECLTPIDTPDQKKCRTAKPDDEQTVKNIAKESFSKSRFHLDPRIGIEIANSIKEQWAGNFFSGNRGDQMVVFEERGEILGFLQTIRLNDQSFLIDLIGVSIGNRGRGIASAMISFAKNKCYTNLPSIKVGTQIANISSLNLYNKLGFRITESKYVFHFMKRPTQ